MNSKGRRMAFKSAAQPTGYKLNLPVNYIINNFNTFYLLQSAYLSAQILILFLKILIT